MNFLLRGSMAASLVLAIALGISLIATVPTEVALDSPDSPANSELAETSNSAALLRGSLGAAPGILARNERAPAQPPGQLREPPGQARKTTTTSLPTTTTTSPEPTPSTSTVPSSSTTTSTAPSPTTSTTSSTTTTTTVGVPNPGGSLRSSVTVRGAYGRDGSASGVDGLKGIGFNTVLSGPSRSTLDDFAARGLQVVVWLGEYDRTSACNFEYSDAQVTEMVSGIAGHPAIAAYLLADEPTYAFARDCKSAPDQLRQRSDLVNSLDPSKPTMVTLTTWDGVEAYPYDYWVDTADIFGLVVYPCYQGTCNFGMIDQAVSVAESVGLGEYWAIVQDFADSWYDLPTADQVNEQFARWSKSRMTGYLVFAADGFSCCQASDFESNPSKAAVLEAWNRS